MLQRLKTMYGEKPGATDGGIGQMKDFYYEAYDRLVKSDVKYRFVIDMTSLKEAL
jgi:hypothetical protein